MVKVFILSIVTAILFILRWNLAGGFIFALAEILFYILFIAFNYKVVGYVAKLLLKKNGLTSGLILIFTFNMIANIILGIFDDTEYWLQILSLNIRNILLIFIGGILFVEFSGENQNSVIRVFWIFTVFAIFQNAFSIIITHDLNGLLLNGVGLSTIALFAIYLFLNHRNILLKLIALIVAILSNSFSAIAAYLLSISLFKFRKTLVIWVCIIPALLMFLAGNFGDQKLFRKSPETLLSGTGRFDIYRECLNYISNNNFGGPACHNSYLTLISQYGVLGLLECLIIVSLFVVFFIKNYPSRKNNDLWFLFAIPIFVAANDFFFITPSSLTIGFSLVILRVNNGRKNVK